MRRRHPKRRFQSHSTSNCSLETLEPRHLLAGDLIGHWLADDLTATTADGAIISDWSDSIGAVGAQSIGEPTLIHNSVGGRAAVRFQPDNGDDGFRIRASQNPIGGLEDFSVVVSFVTSATSLQGDNGAWFTNTGLVDSNAQGFSQDWGLSINQDGKIATGTGGGFIKPQTTLYSDATGLNDGERHTVAMTLTAGNLSIHIDDQPVTTRTDPNAGPRSPLDVTFGILQVDTLPFEGDITQIRFYDGALTPEEFSGIREDINQYYSNSAPVAVDDTYETAEDTVFFTIPANLGLLANDSDPDGDALSAVLVQQPQESSVSVSADGSFVYFPARNFFGTDTFTYTANDFRPGNEATVTITVTPKYDPPKAVADSYEVTPGEVFNLPGLVGLLINDQNPDEADLTAVLADNVGDGSLTLSPDGGFTYDPGGFFGTTTFSYRASDGVSESAPATVTLIVNSAPMTADDAYSVDEDGDLTVNAAEGLLANDVDREGDSLTLELLTEPQHGSLTVEQDGSFQYQPFTNFFGEDSFTYLLNDGRDASEPATVALSIKSVNDAPNSRSDSYILTPNQELNVAADVGVLSNDTDIDGPTLTATLITEPSRGVVTLQPDGAFSFQANPGFSGLDSFTYQATDSIDLSAITTVTIIADGGAAQTSDPSGDSVVTFNEIMYNPVGVEADEEWIELHNQMGIDMDISGWRLAGGVSYDFAEGTVIPGNSYLVIAGNPEAFKLATGVDAMGPFEGRLNNNGEELLLINNSDRYLDILDYRDGGNWPIGADGTGATLAKAALHRASGKSENWRASVEIGGTPGAENFPLFNADRTDTIEVSWGSEWRVNATGADLGSDWLATNFDDSQWQTATGLFESGNPEFPPANASKLAEAGEGLVGYWKFDDSGANAVDGGTDAELISGARLTSDPSRGQVVRLDGRNDYISAGELPAIGVNDDFTWSVWVNQDDADNVNAVVLGNRTGGQENPLQFIKVTPTNFEYYSGGGDPIIPYAIPNQRWVHLAVAKTGPTLTYYVNGESVGSGETSADMGANPFYIGGDPNASREFADGLIDDVAVWTRALPIEAIEGLAAGTYDPLTAPTILTDGPVVPDGLPATTTELPADLTTYYFRNDFFFEGDRNQNPVLQLTNLTDDGAVVYLNGEEVHRQNMPTTEISSDTSALEEIDNIGALSVLLPTNALQQGSNSLAIEVHQNRPGAGDMFFAAELVSTAVPLDPNAVALPVLNEIASADDANFQIEILNPSSQTINLADFQLNSTDAEHVAISLGDGQLAAGQFTTISGQQLGYQPVDGERLFITYQSGQRLADTQAVDDQLRGRSDQHDGRWLFPDAATFGSGNGFTIEDAIVINEINYHAPGFYAEQLDRLFENGEQWVELYNRSDTRTIDLSGWEFSEGIDFEFPAGTTLGPQQYLVISNDPGSLAASRVGLDASQVFGPFDQNLSNAGELIELSDAKGNPTDSVHYYDGGRWAGSADAKGASLELRDPFADNSVAEAWAASDETDQNGWQTITYGGNGKRLNGDPTKYNEFLLGLLDSGVVLIDDVQVIENPGTPDERQLIQNGSFESDSIGADAEHWRVVGNQQGMVVEDPTDPNNRVLRLTASGPTEHMHNNGGTTLKDGDEYIKLSNSADYEISFRAKWVSGSNQLHSRLYFNRLPRVTRVARPVSVGTPGEANSQAEANIGPTYVGMVHSPAVPDVNQPVTVSVNAADAQGIEELTLRYSVNGADFNSVAMQAGNSGQYTGLIPGQAQAALVHFYLEGRDQSGATSMFPAAGPDSRALYRVQDDKGTEDQRHNLRILMTDADASRLHEKTNVMSNHRLGTTVIYREGEIYYDVGIRLKGSQRGRDKVVRAGFNIGFDPSQLFRDVHSTIGVDRSGSGDEYSQEEIIVRQVFNHAGNVPQIYDDLINVIAPQSRHDGSAMLNLARYNDVFLDSQYENGSQGTAFEYELIYYPTSQEGGIEGLKKPNPDSVVGVPMATPREESDNKESFRWHWLIENNRPEDDYSQLQEALAAIGQRTSSDTFHEDTQRLLDVDQWLRSFAVVALTGIGDNYGNGSQHNGIFYVRPSDNRLLFMPWDMDFSFTQGATSGAVSNGELRKLLTDPGNEHSYYGHLHDIISTTFNAEYMSGWIDHFDELVPGQNFFQGYKSYINTRANAVTKSIERAIDVVPFEISGDDPLDVGDLAVAELTGTGWVDVREIRIAGQDLALPITWTSPNEWQVSIPVDPGTHPIVLEAYNFQDELVTSDTVTITSSAVIPVRSSLRVSELQYNPSGAVADEPDVNNDQFEFVELTNVGETAIDLAGVRFVQVEQGDDVSGITFTFSSQSLEPGGFVIVPRDLDAFQARYGSELPMALGQGNAENQNQYRGRLDNGGETITLLDATGATVQQFTYDDAWYASTDGDGNSLEFIDPSQSDLNAWNESSQWRASAALGGTPGQASLVIGDSNFDGVFNSSDLVVVMQAGQYEDDIPNNSTWAEGDWNGDGDFTTSDFVFAFAAATYMDAEPLAAANIENIAAALLSAQQPQRTDRADTNRTARLQPKSVTRETDLEAIAVDRIFERDQHPAEFAETHHDLLETPDDDFDLF